MTTRKGSAVTIWFSFAERQNLEEGAALTGYKHLSTYIKDRVFARSDYRVAGESIGSGLDQDVDVATRLDLLLADQALEKAMLAFIVSVLVRDMNHSNKLEMVRRFSGVQNEKDLFDSLGEVGAVISQFSKQIE